MNNQKKIIIVAGEESGDMYASKIINDFSKENNIKFYGMGSNKMKETKATLLLDSSNLSVVGFFEILKIYPRLLKALNYMKRSIQDINPDLLILIDYQEFNMKLAKYAKSNGIKVLFYISPQVWAWRENRIKNIKNYIDIMAVIFPFEKKFYENAGIKSYYVGHPLIQDNLYQKNYSNKKDFIGFFPGSRFSEVKNHLPIVNRVIESMNNKNKKYKFLISRSRNINISIYEKYFSNKDYVSIVSNENIYETIDLCKVAVAASGTITLQIALKKIPLCVFYKLSNATYFLVKFLIKTKFISLINIVLGKKVVQEFIQSDASTENIEEEIKKLISDNKYRENLKNGISSIEKVLENNDSKIDMKEVIKKSL
tara:strand:+ start:3560 stop:4666 length:1107 start_codon:yes stop_codon:yes gene_type:complete